MTPINWSRFDENQKAQDISFESFCYQVAYLKYHQYGYFENYYNTPGSEFYLTLHTDCPELNLKAGAVVGWQAKWWYDRDDFTSLQKDRKATLVENFATTLKRHSNLATWIICTPGKFIEDAFTSLVQSLHSLSSETNIQHWEKDTFQNLQSYDHEKFGILFHHYFSSSFIGLDTLKKYTQRQIGYLHSKFDTDLYVPSKHDENILQIINYEYLYNKLELKSTYINDDIKRAKERIAELNITSFLSADYAKNISELFDVIISALLDICVVLESKLNIDKCKNIAQIIDTYHTAYGSYADALNESIQRNTWAKDIGEKYIQINEWKHREIIEEVRRLDRHISKSDNDYLGAGFANFTSVEELLSPIFQKDILVLSSAGYGKTNIACNIARECLNRDVPVILLLGSHFRKPELPQKIIIERLGIDRNYDFKQFLCALNTLGFVKNYKIPIIIDGLNESTPFKEIWDTNINDMIEEINQLDYVCLITTCRDRYVKPIFGQDASALENTFFLEGLAGKQKNVAIKKYFSKYNITPISWSFNHDIFKQPLLLKIFSEANRNCKNINISIENIFHSIDKYYTSILDATTDDRLLKANTDKRISTLCNNLWEQNSRDVYIQDFVTVLSPNSDKFSGTTAEKILDEGLYLFQKNLDGSENEKIQFAYDLVAGYMIASRVVLSLNRDIEGLKEYFKRDDIQAKIIGGEKAHPLSEDIMMALIYLVPAKFGVELFEIFENVAAVEISYRNIDYFIGNTVAFKKILTLYTNTSDDTLLRALLLNKLFENIVQKQVFGLSLFTVSILTNLNQTDIDIYWTENIRQRNSESYDLLKKINGLANIDSVTVDELDEYFYISFLFTTSTNTVIRDLSTHNLYLLGTKHPEALLRVCHECYRTKDANSIESLFASICGVSISIRTESLTLQVLEFIFEKFLPEWSNTHVGVIEYILTIVEFAHIKYDINYKHRIAFYKAGFITSKPKKDFLRSLTGVDMYDFRKYQIAAISTNEFRKRKTLRQEEVIDLLVERVYQKGYSEELFAQINNQFSNDSHYGYGSKIKYYSEKYLWQAYFELVGYLYLNGRLKSEDKNRYRCSYLRYDPTFPVLPRRIQIITECFFPAKNDSVQEWINSENDNFINSYYIHKLYTANNWVLLNASLDQSGTENNTKFILHIESMLISKDNIANFKIIVNNDGYDSFDDDENYNIYSGEISWSNFLKKRGKTYRERKYDLTNLVREYRWTAWSNHRAENPEFPYLNPTISNMCKLRFDPLDLSYYNDTNEQVTKYVWNEQARLLYIREDALKKILKRTKQELIWYQFASKYGEFSKHFNNELDPSMKDIRRAIVYSEICGK